MKREMCSATLYHTTEFNILVLESKTWPENFTKEKKIKVQNVVSIK